jgi:hypothetical protein
MCADKNYGNSTIGDNKSLKDSFPELNRLEREVDHLLTNSEIYTGWKLTCKLTTTTPLIMFMGLRIITGESY